jgi:hypothetical protein
MLAACGSSNSVNYLPLNYISINYTDYTFPPPYYQAIDFSRDIVSENDRSAFLNITSLGLFPILMPDRRGIITSSAFKLTAFYEGDHSIDIYVNPEFGIENFAEQEAMNYAEVIGRVPAFLRNGIAEVYLHHGDEPLTGENNYLIIYSDRADTLNGEGILEEVLIHESVHVSLNMLTFSNEWQLAQFNDGIPISLLAYDLFNEDVAESLLSYLAVRYRANRLPVSVEQTILATIPNRIDYLDFLGFDMDPIVQDQPGEWISDNDQSIISYQPFLFAYYEQWEQYLSY